MCAVFQSISKSYKLSFLCRKGINVDYLKLLFQFRWTIRNCFRPYNFFCQFFWVFLWFQNEIWSVFNIFLIKMKSLQFCSKNTFSADLVDASVSHLWSMDAYILRHMNFFRRVGRFRDFHFHRWPPVVHRWSIGGSVLNHRWDPMESQYVNLIEKQDARETLW